MLNRRGLLDHGPGIEVGSSSLEEGRKIEHGIQHDGVSDNR